MATLTAALGAIALGTAAVVASIRAHDDWLTSLQSAAQIGWVVIPAVVAGLIRSARRAKAPAEQEAQRREVEAERLRLAREVHDVVGHGLSLISLQAGVALHVIEHRPLLRPLFGSRGTLTACRSLSTTTARPLLLWTRSQATG